MNFKNLIAASWRAGFIGAALAIVVGFLFLTQPFGAGIVGLSYDSLFRFRQEVPVEGVTILYMDPESDARLGQQRRGSYDRALHARLIERLHEFKPRAIVFDLLFEASAEDPATDELFARAAKDAGNVVVGGKSTPDLYEGEIVGWHLTPPFAALREAARWGVVEVAGQDKVFRSHYYREDLDRPSMAWQVAELTEANPPKKYEPRWINYYGPPGMLPHFSYWEALEANAIPATALSNKVIFVGGLYDIGYAGGRRSDDYATPYTAWTGRRSAGVEIQATAYLNLVRGDWLRRTSPWVEVTIILLCGLAFGIEFAIFRPVRAAVLGAIAFLLVGAVAVLLTWQGFVWFPWLVVGAIQIPCALAWTVLVYARRLQREKHALAQALAMVSRGEGSPAMASGSTPAAVLSPRGSPSTFLSPTLGPGVSLAATRDLARPIIPDHELLRCIGKGAYGEVFLARNVLGGFHAVKIVHRNSAHDPAALDREFNGLKNFTPISRSHPGLVSILQVGRNEGVDYLYYVMELGDDEQTGQKIDPEKYSARTLARDLKRRGRLPLEECLRICIPLADALDYLHRQKLIHRDIKPSNIIFVGGQPKFADIGLVTEVVTAQREMTVVGTPGRMAPEGPGKSTADIYSLGKVIYEAGFGMDVNRFPELPTEIVEAAAESEWFELNHIVMRACEQDARGRYQTAAELRSDLVTLHRRVGESRLQMP